MSLHESVHLPEPDLATATFTDRSRIWDGWAHCARKRYLKYHSGPSGYGIQRRAMSLPLATGTYTHQILAELLLDRKVMDAKQTDGQISDDLRARLIISKQIARYKKSAAERGFQEGLTDESDRVIAEQAALIESFGWAAYYYWIPQLLEEFEPLIVEEEINLVLPGSDLWVMLRPDLVLRRRMDGGAVQVDFKTSGAITMPSWRRQWEDSGQLTLQGWGAGKKLGEPVDFAYIYALNKGRREKEKGTELWKSFTPFLYAYRKPANPPYEEEDWRDSYEWVDEATGEKRRVGSKHQRTAVYEYPFPGKPAEMSNPEYWVRALDPATVARQREVLGPFQALPHQVSSVLAAVVGEETRWREKLWLIYDAGEKAGWDESSEEFQAVLDREAPRTWQCHEFGKDCEFLPICKRMQGWEAPLENGYELRRPHHAAELRQGELRGVAFPAAEGEDDE